MLPLMFDRVPPLQTRRAFEAAFHSRASGWRLHRLKARHSDLDIHPDVTDVNIDPNEGGSPRPFATAAAVIGTPSPNRYWKRA
jgi:hypothetical protein